MADLKIFCEKHLVHLGEKCLYLETTEVIRASPCSNDRCSRSTEDDRGQFLVTRQKVDNLRGRRHVVTAQTGEDGLAQPQDGKQNTVMRYDLHYHHPPFLSTIWCLDPASDRGH